MFDLNEFTSFLLHSDLIILHYHPVFGKFFWVFNPILIFRYWGIPSPSLPPFFPSLTSVIAFSTLSPSLAISFSSTIDSTRSLNVIESSPWDDVTNTRGSASWRSYVDYADHRFRVNHRWKALKIVRNVLHSYLKLIPEQNAPFPLVCKWDWEGRTLHPIWENLILSLFVMLSQKIAVIQKNSPERGQIQSQGIDRFARSR